ncbi:6-phosphogluconolactonase [Limibacterium fermenti]|uniref:6-phosphogluconolactonase n=1 Tax=Limibacterium fermenti TaxID=3229863 RepID=UPI003A77BD3A
METEIKIFEDIEALNNAFTEWLKEILAQKEVVTLALSGGSTPKSLFRYWAEEHRDDIEWGKIRFFWGDERCVGPTDEQSNYRMARENLFDFIPVSEKQIFHIHGEDDPTSEANRYGEIISRATDSIEGMPAFDIVMLGMGDDGHTASIFPHEIDLWDNGHVCVVGTHPDSGQKRISLSGRVINNARHVAFLVTGEAKADKVREIMAPRHRNTSRYPAARVNPSHGTLTWFLDKKAAGK